MAEITRLDVCGTCCPVPVIQLAKTTSQMQTGQLLEVTGNDPLFASAVQDFCQARGHALIASEPAGPGATRITLRIGG